MAASMCFENLLQHVTILYEFLKGFILVVELY